MATAGQSKPMASASDPALQMTSDIGQPHTLPVGVAVGRPHCQRVSGHVYQDHIWLSLLRYGAHWLIIGDCRPYTVATMRENNCFIYCIVVQGTDRQARQTSNMSMETAGRAEHSMYERSCEQMSARSTRGEKREHKHQEELHQL